MVNNGNVGKNSIKNTNAPLTNTVETLQRVQFYGWSTKEDLKEVQ